MVVIGEVVFNSDMSFGESQITHAEIAFTRAFCVLADFVAILLTVVVLDELTNASVAVFGTSAFLALFVLLANRIEWVNWVTVAHVGHWSVAKNETMTSVGPVLALVKLRIVMLHHVNQLFVSLLAFLFDITCHSLVVGGGGEG